MPPSKSIWDAEVRQSLAISCVGLGYNTYANPFICKAAAKQTVLQKYTGREFILPNMRFNDLPSYVNIELNLGQPSKRGFLYSGYCRISDW